MTTILEDQERPLISIGDTRSYCADCGGELGMLRITKGYLRLGHVKEPPTLHAPRLRLARSASQPAIPVTVAGQNGAPPVMAVRPRNGDGLTGAPTTHPRRVARGNLPAGVRSDTDGDIGDPSSGR